MPGLRLRETQTVRYFLQKHSSHCGTKLLLSAFRLAVWYKRPVVEPSSKRGKTSR